MSHGDDLMGDFMAPDPLAKPLDQLVKERWQSKILDTGPNGPDPLPDSVGMPPGYVPTVPLPAPVKHKHADLLKQWADDYSLRFFWWDWSHRAWVEASPEAVIRAHDLNALCVAHTRPTEPLKRFCTIGSFSYPEPERVAPAIGTICYYPTLSNGTNSWNTFTWTGEDFDQRMLARGLIHLDGTSAKQHAEAMLLASKAAFNKLA